MVKLSAGNEVLAYCGKKNCKSILAHTIVVMKTDEVPDKVKCNTCKSTHIFKEKAPTRRKSVTSARGKKASVLDEWEDKVKSSTEPSVKYSPKTSFNIGQLVDHPKYGTGVVERKIDSNKIEILFEKTLKTLMHNL